MLSIAYARTPWHVCLSLSLMVMVFALTAPSKSRKTHAILKNTRLRHNDGKLEILPMS